VKIWKLNPLNAKLNPICHLLALARAHHFVDVSRIRVKFPYILNTQTLRRKHVTTQLLTGQENKQKILFGIDQNHSFLYIMQYGLRVCCDNNQ
jgi:hypothetical protein